MFCLMSNLQFLQKFAPSKCLLLLLLLLLLLQSQGQAQLGGPSVERLGGEKSNAPTKVEIVSPYGDPINSATEKNEWTFNTASPGVLSVRCEAKLTPDNAETRAWAEENVVWSFEGETGSTTAWVDSAGNPADNKGALVFYQATGLPETNSGFGDKKVVATVKGKVINRQIQVFFEQDCKQSLQHSGKQRLAKLDVLLDADGNAFGVTSTHIRL